MYPKSLSSNNQVFTSVAVLTLASAWKRHYLVYRQVSTSVMFSFPPPKEPSIRHRQLASVSFCCCFHSALNRCLDFLIFKKKIPLFLYHFLLCITTKPPGSFIYAHLPFSSSLQSTAIWVQLSLLPRYTLPPKLLWQSDLLRSFLLNPADIFSSFLIRPFCSIVIIE